MNRIQERSRELTCSRRAKRPEKIRRDIRLPGQDWWMDTVTRPLPTDRRAEAPRRTQSR